MTPSDHYWLKEYDPFRTRDLDLSLNFTHCEAGELLMYTCIVACRKVQ